MGFRLSATSAVLTASRASYEERSVSKVRRVRARSDEYHHSQGIEEARRDGATQRSSGFDGAGGGEGVELR